jgi:hypothetical protein
MSGLIPNIQANENQSLGMANLPGSRPQASERSRGLSDITSLETSGPAIVRVALTRRGAVW